MSDLAARLAHNIRELRQARGFTQQQMAKLSGLPRATWSHLESGSGNPTLTVLHAVCSALQVSLEEIVAEPRASARLYPKGTLPWKIRGNVEVSSLLPDKIPGTQIERLELPLGSRMIGVPHTPGTREYLSCERGEIELVASGESFPMKEGDVVVFRGDQRHSYRNAGRTVAVGYSVVLLKQID
ncbi:MAG TPA: XRE family transcriptional regulator [Polyangiaceae bacterium]|jgi:transcriptional regulator with XRE-family HTH domain|nr:XRE family transcriptional regulator [Polyangiaceae bacterium]